MSSVGEQALARAEKRKKVASLRDDLLRAQRYRQTKNELNRIAGVLYNRLPHSKAELSLHAAQAEKSTGTLWRTPNAAPLIRLC